MKNINKNGSLNSRLIALNNAYSAGDTKTVRFLIDSLKEKRDYYETVSVESLREQVESYEEKLYGSNAIKGEERDLVNSEIIALREQIVEKKDFVKNADLINEICNENLSTLLPEATKRIKRNRAIKGAVAAATVIAIIALGAKGCSKRKTDDSQTRSTTTQTIVLENGDEPISTSEEYYFEETEAIDFEPTESGFNINPVIGTGNNGGSNNGGSNNGGSNNGGTSTGSTTNGTTQPSNVITIPNPDGSGTTVVITYNDDGEPNPITWPTAETTIVAPIIDTTPTGSDRLPVEPSIIVDPIPTDTVPTATTIVDPTPSITPAIPTGDDPEIPETTYPTEPYVPVPTDATRPADPTWPTSTPTSTPTLPDIPTFDLEDANVIEYDINGNVVGKTMGLRR